MTFFKSMLHDAEDGSWSSKRIITLLAFIFCSIAFFANLFFGKQMDSMMFEGMMYIAIAGLGVTVTERFASRNNNFSRNNYQEPINSRRTYGRPLPRVDENEI